MELIVNGSLLATFMCTPENLKELAVGHLVSKQLLTSLTDIHMVGACDDMSKIYVQLSYELPGSDMEYGKLIVSGCGSGGNFNHEQIANYWIDSDFSLDSKLLTQGFCEMNSRAELYQKIGGIHSAALVTAQGVLEVIEDVGRHNAIDKIIGRSTFRGYNPEECALITTGRLSSDMVLKSLGAGFPLLATRSIPTTMAYELAQQTGITLVGRGNLYKKYVYCHEQRVTNTDSTEKCDQNSIATTEEKSNIEEGSGC